MTARNLDLHEALRAYVFVGMGVIQKNYDKTADARTSVPTWLRRDWGYERSYKTEPNPYEFINTLLPTLHSLDEFSRAVATLKGVGEIANQLDALVSSPFIGRGINAAFIADDFFADGIIATQSLDFDEDFFEERYATIEQALYKEDIEVVALAPLYGFSMEDSEVTLSDDLKIVELQPKEVDLVLQAGLVPSELDNPEFVMSEGKLCAIRHRSRHPKLINDDDDDDDPATNPAKLARQVEEQIESVGHALRIYKRGRIGLPGLVQLHSDWPFREEVGGWHMEPVAPFPPSRYRFSAEDARDFPDFWTMLRLARVTRHRSLAMAIRRFSLAHERRRAEDSLLDLMIAAESLFLSDAGDPQFKGELSYRLALRAAYFLGADGSARQDLFKHFRSAYSLRSSIAHGADPSTIKLKLADGSATGLDQFTWITGEFLRTAITKAVRVAPEAGPLVRWEELILAH